MVEKALGRPEKPPPLDEPLEKLRGKRILVTGAKGSIGSALLEQIDAVPTDLDSLDVRDEGAVRAALYSADPEVIFHLAAAKSAPEGETDPEAALEVNALGTRNILRHTKAKVVTVSTCKACEPETVYGASKLLAERMTLNRGGSVARLYNVIETQGNVFETWAGIPEDDPIPVTPCYRYFISLKEAISLVLWAAVLPSGRYAVNPQGARLMRGVAQHLYPKRRLSPMEPRRGDRLREPLVARHERIEYLEGGLWQIRGDHDE